MARNDDTIREKFMEFSEMTDSTKPMSEIGSTIGSYKLLGVLGEGGFGMVYLAEQQQPIKRLVALKVIKPGMDTKQVIARFETERQALAMLDHPHIARVFDAGATEAGRPYFAMEYVKGIPITEYCDRYNLSTQERLRLFIPLCQAIQHAHQKGIIHRDIKPSNALVILHDKKPIPKIIDFGVAKALTQRLTERTLFTEQGQCIGTPEYMSPEQAEITGLDVDTRSDIYSLGVLLYELLTGCTPFDGKELRSKGYAEMQRIICEQDPIKPSTKLTTLGGRLGDVAKHRSSTAEQLRKSVRGDLDWVVMKAMEKDRTRRYETANGLATDIDRHLNNEPVTARPPSKLYRFQKLVRRNKSAFAVAAVVVAALVLGTVVSTWQAVRATRAEREQSRLRHDAIEAREAETVQRQRAEAGERLARLHLYDADMNLAGQALQENNLGRAMSFLNLHRPARTGGVDLRGWEWQYLWGQCRTDELTTIGRHDGIVQSVAVSPDGQWVASGGWDGLLKIWTPARGAGRWEAVANVQLGGGPVCSVAFSPDGRWLAAGTKKNEFALFRSPDWQQESSGLTATSPETDFISLAFSPDSRLLAVGGDVWSMDTRTRLRTLPCRKFTWGEPAVAWLPNSQTLAGFGKSNGDYQVTLFDVSSPNPDATLAVIPLRRDSGVPTQPLTLAFSPDGGHLAVGFWDGTIRIYASGDWSEVTALTNHTAWVSSLAFSKNGELLASASADHRIKVWRTRGWQEAASLRGHLEEVWGVAFTPDGERLVTGSKDNSVRLWSVARRAQPLDEISVWAEDMRFFGLSGTCPFRVGPSNVLTIWDQETLEVRKQISDYPVADVLFSVPSPDARLLFLFTDGGGAWLMDLAERADARPVCLQSEGLRFRAGAFSDHGSWLALADENTVRVWTLKKGQPLLAFTSQERDVHLVSFSIDERFLGAAAGPGSIEQTIVVWDTASGKELLRHQAHHDWVSGIDFSPDGRLAATVDCSNICKLFDVRSRREVATLRGQLMALHSVCFSPDGRRLAAGTGDGCINVWDLETGREVLVLKGHRDLLGWLRFHPRGDWLLSSEGRTLRLWRAPSWAEIEAEEKRLGIAQSP